MYIIQLTCKHAVFHYSSFSMIIVSKNFIPAWLIIATCMSHKTIPWQQASYIAIVIWPRQQLAIYDIKST